MLSEMERPLTIKLRGKVSDLYRSRRSFYGRQKLEEFVLKEDALFSSHAPVVFYANPCNSASFQTA